MGYVWVLPTPIPTGNSVLGYRAGRRCAEPRLGCLGLFGRPEGAIYSPGSLSLKVHLWECITFNV